MILEGMRSETCAYANCAPCVVLSGCTINELSSSEENRGPRTRQEGEFSDKEFFRGEGLGVDGWLLQNDKLSLYPAIFQCLGVAPPISHQHRRGATIRLCPLSVDRVEMQAALDKE